MMRAADHSRRPRVLVVGSGVAGLETLLALRAAAGDRVEITLLGPDAKFINRSMAVDQPAAVGHIQALPLRDVARELDITWQRGSLERFDPEQRVVWTENGRELLYDHLVLAVGARPDRTALASGVLTFQHSDDAHGYRHLLRLLQAGRVTQVAFVQPRSASWPLTLYQLALVMAEQCEIHAGQVELSFVTPERAPLEIFGAAASHAVRHLLDNMGVRLYTHSYGVLSRPGRLHLSPSGRLLSVDRIVTTPRLVGPGLPGVPADPRGFIRIDALGRVIGLDHVFAAGDATSFPVKQGGIAAQQADAVAQAIAATVGVSIAPRPFRPVLRGVLVADGVTHYLRASIAGGGGDTCSVSERPLWWPPNRLGGRYLAPYLSSRAAGAVMFSEIPASPGTPPERSTIDGLPVIGELADLSVR